MRYFSTLPLARKTNVDLYAKDNARRSLLSTRVTFPNCLSCSIQNFIVSKHIIVTIITWKTLTKCLVENFMR